MRNYKQILKILYDKIKNAKKDFSKKIPELFQDFCQIFNFPGNAFLRLKPIPGLTRTSGYPEYSYF